MDSSFDPPTIGAMQYAEQRMVRTPTLAERLDHAVKQAEERLVAVNQAREIFRKNPDLEVLINLMQKGLF